MFEVYKRYFEFQGRAGRKEYWLYVLVLFVELFVALLFDWLALGIAPGQAIGVAYPLVLAANIIPSLSVGVRRLHDTNRSGWWLLISLIPLVGGLVVFVFAVLPGTPGPNRFGPRPGAPLQDLQETFA